MNNYTKMQDDYYESTAELMHSAGGPGGHQQHDSNPDYWNTLLEPLKSMTGTDIWALDFGCGQGRNIKNMYKVNGMLHRVDGVDIASSNLVKAHDFLESLKQSDPNFAGLNYYLYHNNGIDLGDIPDSQYDFIMSTIVFQHIAVHDIRYKLKEEIYRILKPGGLFSFQMGFGVGHPDSCHYLDNSYTAGATNGMFDTRVDNEALLFNDLTKIGFTIKNHKVSHPYYDRHPNWIYVLAEK
jgi:SAM-dependent methyltransferase